MKKIFTSLFILLITLCGIQKTYAVSFEEAITQTKPCALLIYADWAENLQPVMTNYGAMEQAFGDKYNFVKINICNREALNYNKMFFIYQNVPYIMLFKERGKISRNITRDCILDNSCIKDKLSFFAN